MTVRKCINCGVVFIGFADGRGKDFSALCFAAHMESHQIAGAPSPAAPFPMTHGSVSVERGTIAHRASVIGDDTYAPLPARMMHPSARLAAIPGGVA